MEWIEKLEKYIKEIKETKPKDRLEFFSTIYQMIIRIGSSLSGWLQWLIDPTILDRFSEEEVEDLFQEFRSLAIKFLELDKKWTKKKVKERIKINKRPIYQM